jgi:endo-1,4-beta-xylanase
MQFNRVINFLSAVLLVAIVVQYSNAQTISSNATGKQGDYYYEYWKDNGTGTMTLGEGCNFTCQWGQVGNILFRKGIRPGSRNQVVTYTADYKPTGNSYLSIYGWMKNPLVEYYFIESWGTWKPPGGSSKGTFDTDSGTYDIYQNQRTGPSIEGNKTFTQYWSVRKTKRTSGTITCANHFKAWESKGMTIGSFYEVSFNVEAYQSSGGSADVKVSMGTSGIENSSSNSSSKTIDRSELGTSCQGHLTVTAGSTQTITFMTPVNRYLSLKVYNCLGQEIAGLGGREYSAGQHTVKCDASNLANGVYVYAIKAGYR